MSEASEPARLGLGARMLAPLGLGSAGKLGKGAKLLRQAQQRRAKGGDADLAQAAKDCERAIELLGQVSDKDPHKLPLLGSAYLTLGGIYMVSGQPGAVESYRRARRLLPALPQPALEFVATSLAAAGEVDDEAVNLMLELLGSRRGQAPTPALQRVYQCLRTLCQVDETADAKVLKARQALCQRVRQADDSLPWVHYETGVARLAGGDVEGARRAFSRARKRGSDAPLLAWYGPFCDGLLAQRAGQWPAAADHFRAATRAAGDRPQAQAQLGATVLRLLEAERRHPDSAALLGEAIAALERAVATRPREAEYLHQLGLAYQRAGRHADAVAKLGEAVALQPQAAALHLALANAQFTAGHLDEAMQSATTAVDLQPQLEAAHRLLGRLHLAAKRYAEAAAELQPLLAPDSDDHRLRADLGEALFGCQRYHEAADVLRPAASQTRRAAYYLGRSYLRLERADDAADVLASLIDPDQVDSAIHYYYGLALAHAGRLGDAAAALDRALQADPANHSMLVQRGHASAGDGRWGEALEFYRRATEARPLTASTWVCLAQAQRMTGAATEALESLRRATELEPDDAQLRVTYGEVCQLAARLDDAGAAFEAACELAPRAALPARRLGVLRCHTKDWPAALTALKRAAELGDDSDELLFFTGLAAAEAADLDRAVEAWGKLLERHPDDQRLALNLNRAQYQLGRQLADEGRYQAAIDAWTACLQGRPQDEELASDLAQLELRLILAAAARDGLDGLRAERTRLEQVARQASHGPITAYLQALLALADGEPQGYLHRLNGLTEQLPGPVRALAAHHRAVACLCLEQYAEAARAAEASQAAGAAQCGADTALVQAIALARQGQWAAAADALSAVA